MNYATWHSMKEISVLVAQSAVYLALFIMSNVIYYKVFSKRLQNKSAWDVRLSFFVRKYHTVLGRIVVLLAFSHGFFMIFYRKIIKHDDYIIAGYFVLIFIFMILMTGCISNLAKKHKVNIQFLKAIKKVHMAVGILFLLAYSLHLFELNMHEKRKLDKSEQAQKLKTIG